MKNLFSVEQYRKHLENFFVYKYDEITVLERKKEIDKYTDTELQKIIDNTIVFADYVIDRIKKEEYSDTVFFSIDIDEMIYTISNGCVGGWPADTLYSLVDYNPDIRISRYLLKKIFPNFDIERNDEVYEEYNEKEDVGSFYAVSKLVIKGPKNKLEEISSNSNLKQEKQQLFVKTLKLIRDKNKHNHLI